MPDPRAEILRPVTVDELREVIDDAIASSPDRPAVSPNREESGAGEAASGDKARAASIIESIGRDFVRLRQEGRSGAWAELEDRLMSNAHILIGSGMISVKDWVSTARDIEDFRKQETGTSLPPGDLLSQWLSVSEVELKEETVPHLPKREKKRKVTV